MIDTKEFIQFLTLRGINSFYGVPDSLLKPLCKELIDLPSNQHQISTNEGNAIASSIGSYLANKKISCVYMQNSGLGNAINPLLSLASKEVYSIPILLIIGWRGELLESGEQIKDEPQHRHQGKLTCSQLELLDIDYKIFSKEISNWQEQLDQLINIAINEKKPVAIVCKKNTFKDVSKKSHFKSNQQNINITREQVIKTIVELDQQNTPIFSTTGMASRELYETRISKDMKPIDFYTVGGMGCVSSIALGFARASKHLKQVICIDGDGSMLMHTGSLFKTAKQPGFIHILINNNAHDSVGGQPTNAFDIDIKKLGYSLGYNFCYSLTDLENFRQTMQKALEDKTISTLIEIKVKKGNRDNLGRPKDHPRTNKEHFMKQWTDI